MSLGDISHDQPQPEAAVVSVDSNKRRRIGTPNGDASEGSIIQVDPFSSTTADHQLGSDDRVHISLPHRTTPYLIRDFWWMVDLSFFSCLKNGKGQGATPLVMSCMKKYKWNEAYARRVLSGYRQYLSLVEDKVSENLDDDCDITEKFYPCSVDVDRMWQEHILDTTNYIHDCLFLCGHFIGRSRELELYADENKQKQRDDATRTALKEKFGEAYDEDLWLNHISPTQARCQPKTEAPATPQQNSQTEEVPVTPEETRGTTPENAKQEEEPGTPPKKITIKAILAGSATEYVFLFAKAKKIKPLLAGAAAQIEIPSSSIGMRFHGKVISPEDTPLALGMKDGDIIELWKKDKKENDQADELDVADD